MGGCSMLATPDGWVRGGAPAPLADTAMGFAARLEWPDFRSNRTLNLNLLFQEGSSVDERVVCNAEVTHRTRTYAWTRCTLSRLSDGGRVAEATGLQLLR